MSGVSQPIGHLAVKVSGVSPEVLSRAYKYTSQFLGGPWKRINPEHLVVKPVSGGLSNYLYLCSLPNNVRTESKNDHMDCPNTVLLRIYGKILQENPETALIINSVIFTLLSEKGLGPRLYGVFNGGRIEEYLPSRCLKTEEMALPDVSRKIAQVLARIHSLQMPLRKEPRWFWKATSQWLDGFSALCEMVVTAAKLDRSQLANLVQNQADVKMKSCPERLLKLLEATMDSPEQLAIWSKVYDWDLKREFAALRDFLLSIPSPVVFCHNDLQEGNILFVGDQLNDVTAIDYEYSSYNTRGFDLANHFCEWSYCYTVKDPPYYSADFPEKFPTFDQQLEFAQAYFDQLRQPSMNDKIIVTDAEILLEINTWVLASHFMWGVWSVLQASLSEINFEYLRYGSVRLSHYFLHKKTLSQWFRQGVLKPTDGLSLDFLDG